ncbi:MAG TPA: acyl-ACP--UDP-N-acetylglucosamine O-acyltransferase [Opitutaceae bacterium]
MIHPTAIVEEGAQLGADCEIMAGAVITRHCRLGDRVVVHPYAVVGGDPQYLKFDRATVSGVEIGAGTVIREHVTINRSIHAGQNTVVGARCFLMAGAHVAHDCAVADDVVLANNALLAGHVAVGPFTFVGGGAAIHQFCRIGEGAMVGGLARVTLDVPPFTMIAERDDIIGFNVVGLKRRGFAREAIRELKAAYRALYYTPGNIRSVASSLLGTVVSPEARRFLEFFTQGKRGLARPSRSTPAATDGDEP